VPEIQAVRGVDPSGALKSLLEKSMVRILGRKKVVGNPLLYGTTQQFLVHFGLNRLEDLPSIEEFDGFMGALAGVEQPLFPGGAVLPDETSEGAEPIIEETAALDVEEPVDPE
jgi:segregation and condensation protein B